MNGGQIHGAGLPVGGIGRLFGTGLASENKLLAGKA